MAVDEIIENNCASHNESLEVVILKIYKLNTMEERVIVETVEERVSHSIAKGA